MNSLEFSIHKNLTFWAFTKDRKQENIFISSPVGEESKLIQNEEPNPQDTLDETVETFASPSDNGFNLTSYSKFYDKCDRLKFQNQL